MRAVLVAAVLWATAAVGDAKCARTELGPKILTPPKAAIPGDGGMLVGWEASMNVERSDADPSVQPKWVAFGANHTKLPIVVDTLAPGLSVYRTKDINGFTLVDAKAKTLATFTRDGAPKLDLPAPLPKSIVLSHFDGFRGGQEHAIDGKFAAVPAQAVAVILYRVSGDKRTALAFRMLDREAETKTQSVSLYADPGHCGWNPPGTTLPAATDDIAVAWVDAYGRQSAPSAKQKLTVNP